MDALGLTLIFVATGLLALLYYRIVPSREVLTKRLPNRVSPASIVLLVVVIGLIWHITQQSGRFIRIRTILGILFDLLLFESLLLLSFRWIKSNIAAVTLCLALAAIAFWVQTTYPSRWVFNLTFILATLGATSVLIRLQYLRTSFLSLLAVLWSAYDILATNFIYPRIYRIADKAHNSFSYPAVAVGNVTLGSGDFMFLVLFSLVLLRDFGRRAALLHIALQSLALFITIIVKSRETIFPYLVIMTPIFFISYWLARKNTSPPSSVESASTAPSATTG